MRFYNPAIARFMSVDPYWGPHNMLFGSNPREVGGVRAPNQLAIMQSLNLYAYVVNNPVRYIDPWGLSALGQRYVHVESGRNLNVRALPNTDSEIVDRLERGEEVTVVVLSEHLRPKCDEGFTWVPIVRGNRLVWVADDFLGHAHPDSVRPVAAVNRDGTVTLPALGERLLSTDLEINVLITSTFEYQLGAAIARGAIINGGFFDYNFVLAGAFADYTFGRQYFDRIRTINAQRDLLFLPDVIFTAFENYAEAKQMTGEPFSAAILAGGLTLADILMPSGPGLSDALESTFGPHFDERMEVAVQDFERLSESYLFFVDTRGRMPYNQFLRGIQNNIQTMDLTGVPNAEQVRENAVWFTQKIIDANNDRSAARAALNELMER